MIEISVETPWLQQGLGKKGFLMVFSDKEGLEHKDIHFQVPCGF